jgi:hypothetical protein
MEMLKRSRLGFVALAAIVYLGLPSLSHATPFNISIDPDTGLPAGDISFKDLPNNNPTSNFNALVTDVGLYDSYFSTNLPDPTMTGFANYENLNGNLAVDVTGFSYAVIHYGKGPGGASPGGGIVFYYLNGMTGNFLFPANGLGPNGFGGISSIRLFGGSPTSVPDGGTSAMLLGVALVSLAGIQRFTKRQRARVS